MKHLKQYESNIQYNIGDYILLRDSIDTLNFYKNYAKIFDFIKDPNEKHFYTLYDVDYIDVSTNIIKNYKRYITDEDIIRKLNDDEIKDFNMFLTAGNYNL